MHVICSFGKGAAGQTTSEVYRTSGLVANGAGRCVDDQGTLRWWEIYKERVRLARSTRGTLTCVYFVPEPLIFRYISCQYERALRRDSPEGPRPTNKGNAKWTLFSVLSPVCSTRF